MFERAPFEACPRCRAFNSFGILSAGGSTIRRRCTACRYAHSEVLPDLDKKVVYLDQFAISEIFKVKAGTRNAAAGGQGFWEEVEAQANRAYLLQQVIFPNSDIHRDETIVSPFGNELALAHEMLSGDVSFNSVNEIELSQALACAEAYLQSKPGPHLNFEVDEILEGERNDWLPDMHVTASMDYGIFSEELRIRREEAASNFAPLWQRWLRDKPTFSDVLKHELRARLTNVEGLGASLHPLFDAISEPTERRDDLVAASASLLGRMLAPGFVFDAGDAFMATVYLVRLAGAHVLGETAAGPIFNYFADVWRDILANRTFSVRNPATSSIFILEALSKGETNRAKLANLVLASEMAVRAHLSDELKANIRALTETKRKSLDDLQQA
jgi:hypothetical protein